MKKSIRYYYFTSIATILVASLFIMGLIQLYLGTTRFREEKEQLLEQLLITIDEGSRLGELTYQEESLPALYYMAEIAGAIIVITDPAGDVVFSTDENIVHNGEVIPQNILDTLYENKSYRELGRLEGIFPHDYYTLAIPLTAHDGTLRGFVFASSDASGLRVYLSDMLSSFVLSAGLVLLISSIFALVFTNRTVIPIRRISAAARRFGEGDYSARVPVEGDDELAQLAITFNEMASSFQTTDLSRRNFMGNIAHELRTPMTTIKGFIDGMLDGTIPESQREKYLAIVSEEVGRLSRLTRNMLDVSRLEAGEYLPNITTFNIWQPLSLVLLSAQQRVEEKNIKMETINAGANILVQADEDFVHQVLFNLLDNAIKFTEAGGTITVSVQPGKPFVTVNIRNSGEGIPAQTIDLIFDRFYKVDESRNSHAGGAGLGLHICKVLVGLMGGRIWADSLEGEWSDFHFTLPAATMPRKPAERKNDVGRRYTGSLEKEEK